MATPDATTSPRVSTPGAPVPDPAAWSLRRDLLGVLVAVAMVLIAYHSVAFGGKTFDTSQFEAGPNGVDAVAMAHAADNTFRVDPGASAWAMVPWAQVTHREIAAGHLPLWNPYEGAGTPLAANGQSSAFDPLMIGVNLHPTTLVWDLTLLFALCLGAAGMYLFLRNLGLRMVASLAGTAAFILCGYFAVNSNNSFLRTYVYLPILFLLVDRTVTSRRAGWVVGLGAALAGTMLVGMPEAFSIVVGAAALYGLFRVALAPSGSRWAAAIRLAGAGVGGLLLAAPMLVLLLGYLPSAFNVHHPGTGDAAAARGALLNWLVPFVNGYPAQLRVPAMVPSRSWVGGAGAGLLVVAAAAPRAMRRYGGWFFLVLAVVLLLKIHGFPVVQLIGKLPLANRINFIAFAAPVVSLGLGAVIAIGAEAIAAGEVRIPWLVVGAAVLAVIVGALVVANRPVLAVAPHRSPVRQYLLYAIALAGAGSVLALALISALAPGVRRLAAPAAAGILVLELLALVWPAGYLPRRNPYVAPPWLSAITAGEAATPQARVFGLDAMLYPNTAGAFGLQDVRSLDALYEQRYVTYVKSFVFPFVDRLTSDGMTPSEVVGNPMFDLTGVRFVVTGPPSASALSASPQYQLLTSAGGGSVFENRNQIPRAFTVRDVHAVGDVTDALRYLQGLGHPAADGTTRVDRFDPSQQAVVESSAPLSAIGPPEPGTTRPAAITSYGPDRVVVQVPPGAPSLLVLTDTYAPGWAVSVNGRPAKLLPTDVLFRGVALGADASRVVFTYRPVPPAVFWALPLAGLVVLLLAAAVAERLRSDAASV